MSNKSDQASLAKHSSVISDDSVQAFLQPFRKKLAHHKHLLLASHYIGSDRISGILPSLDHMLQAVKGPQKALWSMINLRDMAKFVDFLHAFYFGTDPEFRRHGNFVWVLELERKKSQLKGQLVRN